MVDSQVTIFITHNTPKIIGSESFYVVSPMPAFKHRKPSIFLPVVVFTALVLSLLVIFVILLSATGSTHTSIVTGLNHLSTTPTYLASGKSVISNSRSYFPVNHLISSFGFGVVEGKHEIIIS
jgi:hypothetical protein